MTSALKCGVLLSITAILFFPVSANSAPEFLRLSITGPSESSMTITWNTDIETESVVRYGTEPGTFEETTGESFRASGELGYIHEVTLENLDPSTEYFYLAGSPSSGFSIENTFTTGPEQDELCGSFSFGFLGDNRPDATFGFGENYPEIMAELAARRPSFILNGGDLVEDGGELDEWINFLEWTTDIGADIPYMTAIGNHDDGGPPGVEDYYFQIFSFPRAIREDESEVEDYYYFTYGNAIFVSLSTESYEGGDIPYGEQAAWLDRVLTENPRKWRIVFLHKPIYTYEDLLGASHEPNEEGQNAALVPVIDRHHVDLVIGSHNHWYERYHPSACATAGRPGSDKPCSVGEGNFAAGTVYVVSGGAGAFTIPEAVCGGILVPVEGRVTCRDPHHYLYITIENEKLTYETWSAHTQEPERIDYFQIVKPADDCAVDPPVDLGPAEPVDTPDVGQPDLGTPDAGTTEEDAPVVTPDSGGNDEPRTQPDRGTGNTQTDTEPSTGSEACGCITGVSGSPAWPVLVLVGLVCMWWTRRRNWSASP